MGAVEFLRVRDALFRLPHTVRENARGWFVGLFVPWIRVVRLVSAFPLGEKFRQERQTSPIIALLSTRSSFS